MIKLKGEKARYFNDYLYEVNQVMKPRNFPNIDDGKYFICGNNAYLLNDNATSIVKLTMDIHNVSSRSTKQQEFDKAIDYLKEHKPTLKLIGDEYYDTFKTKKIKKSVNSVKIDNSKLYIKSFDNENEVDNEFIEKFNSYNILSKINEFNKKIESELNEDNHIGRFEFSYELYKEMKDKRAISDVYLNLDSEEISIDEPLDDNHVFFKIGYNFLVKFKKKSKKAYIDLYNNKEMKNKYNIKFYLRNKYYELNQYFTFINK